MCQTKNVNDATFDVFHRVVIDKHIDNQILTSARTMTGLNNTISKSLKVCHNKFTPIGASAIYNPNT